MTQEPQPRLPIFSLRGLFSLTLTIATAAFMIQFAIKNPQAIAPFVILSWFVSVLIAPSLLTRMQDARLRFSWGCAYVMFSPVFFAVLAATLVYLAEMYAAR